MLKSKFTCMRVCERRVCVHGYMADLFRTLAEQANSSALPPFLCLSLSLHVCLALLEKRSGGDGVIKTEIEENTLESK